MSVERLRRLMAELEELDGKLSRLVNFIACPLFDQLDADEQYDLKHQEAGMTRYRRHLASRVGRAASALVG